MQIQVNPYLVFDGQCEEAFRFYEKVTGGRIQAMLRCGETPAKDHMPPEMHDKIMHACLMFGEHALMGSDAPTPQFTAMKGMSVALHTQTPEEAERVFAQLSDGGTVEMPLQPTFWAQRFGTFTDRYGTPWMINCSITEPDCG